MGSALSALRRAGIIHADIKPSHIMTDKPKHKPFPIKLIDFGSALSTSDAKQGSTLGTIGFMSPEIMLGLPFTQATDVWSLGCVVAYMMLGNPLFSTQSEYKAFKDIHQIIGQPSDELLDKGLYTSKFYKKCNNKWSPVEAMDPVEVIALDERLTSLDDLKTMNLRPFKRLDLAEREQCVDLLKEMLQINPEDRITPEEIKKHPFITGHYPCKSPWRDFMPFQKNDKVSPLELENQPSQRTLNTLPSKKPEAYKVPPVTCASLPSKPSLHRVIMQKSKKKETLNQAFPLVNSGYGLHVGNGFWRVPEHFGNEMSGLATTLTKADFGVREPMTHVGLPSSIRQESGLKKEHTVNDAYLTWDQSLYLKQQCQMLGEAVQELDFSTPDIDKLEVIGSSIYPPICSETCSDASLENTKKEEEPMDRHEDTKDTKEIPKSIDVEPDSKNPPIPALRISRHANGTENSKGQVGINVNILFESPPGEPRMSCFELRNIGSTPIFYSWKRLPLPHSFPNLLPSTMTQNSFYFTSSSGVMLPGESHVLRASFKSHKHGVKTERWQMNTHPVLPQGPTQVTLTGVVLYQDRNAANRQRIREKCEKLVTHENGIIVSQSIVYDMVNGIHTPERPSSPAELTEEEEFLHKNPKLCYINHPVEGLKKLWHNVKPESAWDLSLSALQQALLSLPNDEVETGLAQLNSLILQLTEPSPELQCPTVALGQLMWRDPVDTMTSEAVRLTQLLNLPENDTWMDEDQKKKKQEDEKVTASLNAQNSSENLVNSKTQRKSRQGDAYFLFL
uniref:Protein kinase domain-containing protein n=1 Tax=Neogobius melanostomus TaxID=47308 RepID=A0A8C6V8X0_9GOBI